MSPVLESKRYGLAEAKDRFSALTAHANATGMPFVVLKSGKPWVEVRPLASEAKLTSDDITVVPLRRSVPVTNIDDLFDGYDGEFEPVEDGFAKPSGREVL